MLSIDRDYFFENHKKNATFSNYGFYMLIKTFSSFLQEFKKKYDRDEKYKI